MRIAARYDTNSRAVTASSGATSNRLVLLQVNLIGYEDYVSVTSVAQNKLGHRADCVRRVSPIRIRQRSVLLQRGGTWVVHVRAQQAVHSGVAVVEAEAELHNGDRVLYALPCSTRAAIQLHQLKPPAYNRGKLLGHVRRAQPHGHVRRVVVLDNVRHGVLLLFWQRHELGVLMYVRERGDVISKGVSIFAVRS